MIAGKSKFPRKKVSPYKTQFDKSKGKLGMIIAKLKSD